MPLAIELAAARVRALSLDDKAALATQVADVASMDQAEEALAIARETGDPALVARALTSCGSIAADNTDTTPRTSHYAFRPTISRPRHRIVDS